MLALFLLLPTILFTDVYSETLTPDCSYAAIDSHFYPIAACTKTKDVGDVDTTYYAFRFICEGNDVIKYEYDTDEYCDGEHIEATIYTDLLDSYECYLDVCEYSNGCSYIGCWNNETDSCQECQDNKELYSRHCLPFITTQCTGNVGGVLKYDECDAGLLTENAYWGTNCSTAIPLYTINSGGSNTSQNCFDEAYYEVDCVARALPDCNYAATGTHYYPINACDRTKAITDSGVEYFAFEYVCIGDDVYRNEYNDSDYCLGTTLTSSEKVNYLLEHYDCDLGDCGYADGCSLSLSGCDEYGCEYNSHCFPTIVDNCVGNVGELLHSGQCENDVLSEDFYYGEDCNGMALWTDEFSGDDTQCGEDIYYKVQCIDPTDTNERQYQTTECVPLPQTTEVETTEAATQSTEPEGSAETTTGPEEPDDSSAISLCVIISWIVCVVVWN